MHINSKTFAIAAMAFIAIGHSFGQATLKNAPNSQTLTSTNGKYTITTLKPTLIDIAKANDQPLSQDGKALKTFETAFQPLINSGWSLMELTNPNLDPSTTFTVNKYIPTITNGGKGDLEFKLLYTQGTNAAAGANNGPAPITTGGPGPVGTGDATGNKAVWTQAIDTSLPNVLPNPYMDVNNAKNFKSPYYPYQYNGSYFYDDPDRTVTLANTPVTWTADLFLTDYNGATKSLNIYGGVQWGFKLAAMAAPEPGPVVALGAGAFLLVRRRARSRR